MKAHVLYGINDLRFEDVDKPVPKRDEVLLKVENVGICGSDIPRIYETGAHRHPLVPGHEFAGTICEEGECAVDLFSASGNFNNSRMMRDGQIATAKTLVGKRVGVFPLIPCGECGPCKSRQYEMCRNYNYLGSRCDGAFAEYVCVPAKNLIELPDNVSFEDAAMLEPTAVAAHAIRRLLSRELCTMTDDYLSKNSGGDTEVAGNSALISNDDTKETGTADSGKKALCETNDSHNLAMHEADKEDNRGTGKKIAVIGLGTIGLLLTMHLLNEFSKDPSYEIIVVGNKEFQKEKAMGLGIKAENYFDSKSGDTVEWILEKTGGMGAYAVFECVGKNETYSQAIEAAAPAGKVMLLGNPASDMALSKNIYWKILRNQLTVMGTWNSSFTGEVTDDWHYVIDKLKEGAIKPSELISHRFDLECLETGLHIMRDKTEDYVKIMISNYAKGEN